MRRTPAPLFTAAVVAALAAGVSAPAAADPAPGVIPGAQDIVCTAPQGASDVLNQLSGDYNASLTDPGAPRWYVWGPQGPSPITAKAGANPITRPSNTTGGLRALDLPGSGVDCAGAARDPQSGDQVSDDFVAFAKEAVAVAGGSRVPANLTTQNLRDLYTCNVTNWHQIDPAYSDSTAKPFLPAYDSNVRAFFLKTIGGGSPVTPGSCVIQGTQENQGSDPALSDPDAIVPYSVSHYIWQVLYGRGGGSDVPGPLTLRSIDGVAPVDTANRRIGDAFAGTVYSHILYNVVRDADWTATDAHATALQNIFGPTGWICTSPTAAGDLQSFGLLPLQGFDCGSSIHS
ncbi:hypothetical protein ACFVSN_15165 [Kitasatospora sp. NPDC057904]|uniref:hypothetical protein n=1 Tax=unclassified Kitasatospora TaxID=2633591 RepID=UPI0036DE4D22